MPNEKLKKLIFTINDEIQLSTKGENAENIPALQSEVQNYLGQLRHWAAPIIDPDGVYKQFKQAEPNIARDALIKVMSQAKEGLSSATGFFARALEQGLIKVPHEKEFQIACRDLEQALTSFIPEEVVPPEMEDLSSLDVMSTDDILDLYLKGKITKERMQEMMNVMSNKTPGMVRQGFYAPLGLSATADNFDEFRSTMGADTVDDLLAAFGLGPKYKPTPPKKYDCSSCGGGNATCHEMHADTDMGYMEIQCPDCGHAEES